MSARALLLAFSSLIVACNAPAEGDLEGDVGEPVVAVLDQAVADGVLRLVNDPLTDVPYLDVDVELDARAARCIVAHRQGADGVDGSEDDDVFGTIEELSAVAYVGEATLLRLADAAEEAGLVTAVVIDGVAFTAEEAADTLLAANEAGFASLVERGGLAEAVAASLIEGREYADLAAVAARPHVGARDVEALRDFAGRWMDAQ
jgi:hypothetical protein